MEAVGRYAVGAVLEGTTVIGAELETTVSVDVDGAAVETLIAGAVPTLDSTGKDATEEAAEATEERTTLIDEIAEATAEDADTMGPLLLPRQTFSSALAAPVYFWSIWHSS